MQEKLNKNDRCAAVLKFIPIPFFTSKFLRESALVYYWFGLNDKVKKGDRVLFSVAGMSISLLKINEKQLYRQICYIFVTMGLRIKNYRRLYV